jgi:hypothetical protein
MSLLHLTILLRDSRVEVLENLQESVGPWRANPRSTPPKIIPLRSIWLESPGKSISPIFKKIGKGSSQKSNKSPRRRASPQSSLKAFAASAEVDPPVSKVKC